MSKMKFITKLLVICLLCAFACGVVSAAITCENVTITPSDDLIAGQEAFADMEIHIPAKSDIKSIALLVELRKVNGTNITSDGKKLKMVFEGGRVTIDCAELAYQVYDSVLTIRLHGYVNPYPYAGQLINVLHVTSINSYGRRDLLYRSPLQRIVKDDKNE